MDVLHFCLVMQQIVKLRLLRSLINDKLLCLFCTTPTTSAQKCQCVSLCPQCVSGKIKLGARSERGSSTAVHKGAVESMASFSNSTHYMRLSLTQAGLCHPAPLSKRMDKIDRHLHLGIGGSQTDKGDNRQDDGRVAFSWL